MNSVSANYRQDCLNLFNMVMISELCIVFLCSFSFFNSFNMLKCINF